LMGRGSDGRENEVFMDNIYCFRIVVVRWIVKNKIGRHKGREKKGGEQQKKVEERQGGTYQNSGI